MEPLIATLIQLAEADATAERTRQQLEAYPTMLADLDKEARQADEALEKLERAKEQAGLARTQAEKDALALRQKVERLEKQQMMVKTAKEAEALTHEVANLNEQIEQTEERGLEQLIEEETLEEKLATARAQREKMAKRHETENTRIAGQSEEKEQRLERLRVERGSWLTQLPDDLQTTYERLQKQFPGSACAPLEGETCGGCHWTLTNGVISKAKLGKEPVHCDHCKRLLYAK